MDFAELLKETMEHSLVEKILPILDNYQLACITQMQMKAKKVDIPKKLEGIKIHCESEIIFLFEQGEINKN